MSKPFTYWVRLAMVATMCTLVTFSPVSAGRLMDRLLNRDACRSQTFDCCEPANSCETSYWVVPTARCQSMPAASGCCSMPADTCDGGAEKAVPPSQGVTEPKPVPEAPKAPQPVPVVETPNIVPQKVLAPDPVVADPAPVVAPPTPIAEQPAPVVAPPTPVAEQPAADVAPPTPIIEQPIPVVTEPAPIVEETKKAVENPFGEAPAATKPADDIFGEAPAAAKPADEPASPAKTALDDLFETDPAPKAEAESTSLKQDTPADDLFGTEPKSDTPDVPAIDELFGKPIATEQNVSQETSNEVQAADGAFIDSVFGTSSRAEKPLDSESLTPEPVLEEPAKAKEPVDELDALFGIGKFAPPSEFKGAEIRQWVDNSGAYQVKARLAVIYVDKIKLLKENGKFTTVSLSRLSDADFGYVSWVATNLTSEHTARMVSSESQLFDSEVAR